MTRSQVVFYCDGVAQNEGSRVIRPMTPQRNFRFRINSYNGDRRFEGSVAHFAVYHRTLSTEELWSHAMAGRSKSLEPYEAAHLDDLFTHLPFCVEHPNRQQLSQHHSGDQTVWNYPSCAPGCLQGDDCAPAGACRQIPGAVYRVRGRCYLATVACHGCLDDIDGARDALRSVPCPQGKSHEVALFHQHAVLSEAPRANTGFAFERGVVTLHANAGQHCERHCIDRPANCRFWSFDPSQSVCLLSADVSINPTRTCVGCISGHVGALGA